MCAYNTSKIKNALWELNTYIKKLIWNIFDLKLLLSKGLQRNVIHIATPTILRRTQKFMLYAKFDLELLSDAEFDNTVRTRYNVFDVKNSWQHWFLSNLPAGMRVNTHGVSDTPSLFSAQHCTTPKSFSDSAL